MAASIQQRWENSRAAKLLAAGAAGGIEQVISALDTYGSGERPPFEPSGNQPQLWSAWVDPVWFEWQCDAAAGAALLAGCSLGTARALALLLSGDDSQTDEEARATYREILDQSASVLGRQLAEHLGRPVNFAPAAESRAPSDMALGEGFRFTLADAKHAVALVPNQQFARALLADENGSEEDSPEDDDAAAPAPAEGQRPQSSRGAVPGGGNDSDRGNFDLLLEIEMELGVSFGRTHLPLEDVLKLSSGAVVELNRSVTDPVDVLVNDAVIARGEVVVVEGNYGVRITEIVSRRERIRSIF